MVYALRTLRFLVVLGVLLLCVFPACFVYAANPTLRITEIMYDAEGGDTGKEFVEVMNTGSEDIDMTRVKFFERNDRPDRPGGSLAQSQGSTILQPGGVAVIVANPTSFLQHYTSFNGVLLDTRNFALLNAGATVSVTIDGRLLHSVTYTTDDGAKGDGTSLHIRQDGDIVADDPSPGVMSGATIADDSGGSERDGEGAVVAQVAPTTSQGRVADTGFSPSAPSPAPDTQRATVSETDPPAKDPPTFVSDPSVVFPASTTRFSVVREGGEQEEVLYGLWNFGDGTYTYGTVVEHVYLHPGAYIVVFQESDGDGSEGFALQKEIRVLFPQVSIERIDDAFVRLHNRHPFVLDVSGWRIESQGVVFDFPMKSLVPRQNSIVVPFASAEGQDIFFVTVGGGQFSGLDASPDDIAVAIDTVKEDETGTVELSVADESSATEHSVQPSAPVFVEEDSVPDQEQVDVAHTDAFVVDVVADQEERGVATRMIAVWLVLLVGIMIVALVPFVLTRREKVRRLTHE